MTEIERWSWIPLEGLVVLEFRELADSFIGRLCDLGSFDGDFDVDFSTIPTTSTCALAASFASFGQEVDGTEAYPSEFGISDPEFSTVDIYSFSGESCGSGRTPSSWLIRESPLEVSCVNCDNCWMDGCADSFSVILSIRGMVARLALRVPGSAGKAG